MRRSEARKVVAAYVADRLGRECAARRGAQAEIARATNFSRGHVNNVIKGQAGVGEDFAERIAAYWGLSYERLQAEAESWQKSSEGAASAQRSQPWMRLRERPEWEPAVEAARAFYKDIPEEYLDRVGLIFDDVTRFIDAQFVGEMARLIWSTEQREIANPPASVVASTNKGHLRDKKTSKP